MRLFGKLSKKIENKIKKEKEAENSVKAPLIS